MKLRIKRLGEVVKITLLEGKIENKELKIGDNYKSELDIHRGTVYYKVCFTEKDAMGLIYHLQERATDFNNSIKDDGYKWECDGCKYECKTKKEPGSQECLQHYTHKNWQQINSNKIEIIEE